MHRPLSPTPKSDERADSIGEDGAHENDSLMDQGLPTSIDFFLNVMLFLVLDKLARYIVADVY